MIPLADDDSEYVRVSAGPDTVTFGTAPFRKADVAPAHEPVAVGIKAFAPVELSIYPLRPSLMEALMYADTEPIAGDVPTPWIV